MTSRMDSFEGKVSSNKSYESDGYFSQFGIEYGSSSLSERKLETESADYPIDYIVAYKNLATDNGIYDP